MRSKSPHSRPRTSFLSGIEFHSFLIWFCSTLVISYWYLLKQPTSGYLYHQVQVGFVAQCEVWCNAAMTRRKVQRNFHLDLLIFWELSNKSCSFCKILLWIHFQSKIFLSSLKLQNDSFKNKYTILMLSTVPSLLHLLYQNTSCRSSQGLQNLQKSPDPEKQ